MFQTFSIGAGSRNVYQNKAPPDAHGTPRRQNKNISRQALNDVFIKNSSGNNMSLKSRFRL
jgi:hypothetical protein